MAISIEFKDKYVYFGPEAGLHTQGEARAEVYDVTGPRYHDGHDLSAMTWYVRAGNPGLYDDHQQAAEGFRRSRQ